MAWALCVTVDTMLIPSASGAGGAGFSSLRKGGVVMVASWQESFEAVVPHVRRYAEKHIVKSLHNREELIADVVLHAMGAFLRKWESEGPAAAVAVRPGSWAHYAVRQVLDGREWGQVDNCRDVGSRRAAKKHGVRVQSLSVPEKRGKGDGKGGVGVDWFIQVADSRINPADLAQLRLDFWQFLKSPQGLGGRRNRFKRRIAFLAARGEQTKRIAEKLSVSPGRVSQVRAELWERWCLMLKQDPATGRDWVEVERDRQWMQLQAVGA